MYTYHSQVEGSSTCKYNVHIPFTGWRKQYM